MISQVISPSVLQRQTLSLRYRNGLSHWALNAGQWPLFNLNILVNVLGRVFCHVPCRE